MKDVSFEAAALQALKKAREINDVPHLMEAVSRATLLIALDPVLVEREFREKMNEGKKI